MKVCAASWAGGLHSQLVDTKLRRHEFAEVDEQKLSTSPFSKQKLIARWPAVPRNEHLSTSKIMKRASHQC